MRIQDRQGPKRLRSAGQRGNKIRVEAGDSKDFSDILQHNQQADWQESLDAMLFKLDEMGQKLTKSFSIYDLKAYKDLLKSFLQEALGQAYILKEETVWSRFSKPKVMQRVELINKHLEELTKLTLEKHKDPLKLVGKLDTIRGLLVDLYS